MTAPWPTFRRSLAAAAAGLVGWSAAVAGCSGPERASAGGFWARALPTTRVSLEPPPALGAPGVVARHEIVGVARIHVRRPAGGPPSVLHIERADGTRVLLSYDIGAGRALPIDVGDNVRVRVLIRRHAEDDGEDVGLVVWLRQPTSGPGEGLEQMVVAVEQRRLLEDEGVPATLRAIAPTQMPVYYTAGRFGQDCDETRQHSWFRFGRAGWLREVAGQRHPLDPRLVAPGGRVDVSDGTDRFDVLLIDNRQTTQSACRVPTEPSWNWAAIAKPVDARQTREATTKR